MKLSPVALAVAAQHGRIHLRPRFSIAAYLLAGGMMQSVRLPGQQPPTRRVSIRELAGASA